MADSTKNAAEKNVGPVKPKNVANTVEVQPESTKQGKEKDSTLLVLSITLIILVVLASGIFYFAKLERNPPHKTYGDYNGFEFYQDNNGFWHTRINSLRGEVDVPFYYHPDQLEIYAFPESIKKELAETQRTGGKVIIAYSNEYKTAGGAGIAAVEITKIVSQVFGISTSSGFMEPIDNLPVASCKNASVSSFVIELAPGNETFVNHSSYCTRLTAKSLDELIQLSDLFSYKITGIMG